MILDDYTPYVFMALRMGRNSIMEFFLNNGISSNLTDEHGDSLIIWATRLGNEKIVEMLLKAGAEPDYQNKLGKNACDYAKTADIWNLLYQNSITTKEEIGKKVFDLSLRAIEKGLDEEGKSLRATAAELGNNDAIRIEANFHGTKTVTTSTFFSSTPSNPPTEPKDLNKQETGYGCK